MIGSAKECEVLYYFEKADGSKQRQIAICESYLSLEIVNFYYDIID